MPRDLVVEGVLLPAAAATVFVFGSLLVGAALRSRAPRRADVSSRGRGSALRRWVIECFDGASVLAPAIAIAFLWSLWTAGRARWPPTMAWEWIAPIVVITAGVAWMLPRRPKWLTWSATIFAGGFAAWALALPGAVEPSRRIVLGIVVFALAAALAWNAERGDRDSRAARSSELLASSIAVIGLSLVVFAGAFATLAAALLSTALTLAVASLAACFVRTLRLGATGGVTAGALLVAGAATGAAYSSAGLPFWHWPVAVVAPLTALIADVSWLPARGRSALRVAIVSIVSIGNGAAALGPIIARGDFPPAV